MTEKSTEVEISLKNAVSREDVTSAFKVLVAYVKKAKAALEQVAAKNKEEMASEVQKTLTALEALEGRVSDALGQTDTQSKAGLEALSSRFMADLEALRGAIPELPPSFDPTGLETRIAEVEGKIVPPQIAEDIRNGLEALPEGDKLVIEAIEGLREELDELKRQATQFGGATRVIGHVQTFANSIISASGDIDGNNDTYDFGQKPTVVVVNGSSYREGHGWEFVDNAVVLDFNPPTGSDVYAVK